MIVTPERTSFEAERRIAQRLATHVQRLYADSYALTDETGFVAGPEFTFPALPVTTFALPDITLDSAGHIRMIEMNGSNGAGTSTHLADFPRARHEVDTITSRGIDLAGDVVLLRPFSPDTRSTPEIRVRAAVLAAVLEDHIGQVVRVAAASNAMLPAGPVIICDAIPAIVDHLKLADGHLWFRNRQVAFLNNVNVVVELARRTDHTVSDILGCLNPEPVHEGTAVAKLSLDKVLQQELIPEASGLRPIDGVMVEGGLEDVIRLARRMAHRYTGAIIKPMAASGGTGVIPVDPTSTHDQIAADLAQAHAKLTAKYGSNYAATCPWAVFEFVDIEPAHHLGKAYRWDMRFEVLAGPDTTIITPLSARLAPQPISGRLDRSTAVVNQTSREKRPGESVSPGDLCLMLNHCPDVLLARMAKSIHQYLSVVVA
jgi:hypothetical protein